MRWRSIQRGLLAATLVTLAACSSDRPKPTPLEPLTPKIGGRQAWVAQLANVDFGLTTLVRDGSVTLAGGDGSVLALDLQSGRELWRAQAGARLSAGVGSDGRFSSVVTRDNVLVTFEAGREKWRTRLNASVSTAPLVAGERVFVLGADRAVHAYDALDGQRLWTLQRPGEPLGLAQTGVLLPYKNTLLVGLGARLTGVDPLNGAVNWEVALGNPRGTNEVERLADLVGPALRHGSQVCARAFQLAVGCVEVERGTLTWARNSAGPSGLGGDAELIVGADASDRITAWRAATGEVAWSNEKMLYRGLSGALVTGRTVVMGDSEGQVHFLDRSNGEPMLRLATDGSAVVGNPVLAANQVLVVTRKGGVFAFRLD